MTSPARFSAKTRWVLFALIIAIAIPCGVWLRIATWDATDRIRFTRDFRNGYFWGSKVMTDAKLIGPASEDVHGFDRWIRFFDAYVDVYDRVYEEAADRDNDYWLDYPPLRLLIMSVWTKSIREKQPTLDVPNSPDVVPLLVFNGTTELISAAGMFWLVLLWARRIRAHHPNLPRRISPEAAALGAALLVWFNPACLINSNGWPQWDVWILPFFIFAAVAGSCSAWLTCGLLLGIAAFLKGQILIVTAFFPLWALFSEGPRASLRVLVGWASAFVGVASPWLLKGFGPYQWIIALVGLAIPLVWARYRKMHSAIPILLTIEAMALVLTGLLAKGSFTWLEIGFHYGSNRYMEMFSGAVYNLPSVLAGLGWSLKDPSFIVHLAPDWVIELPSLRLLLRVAYALLLVLSAYAMAFHARRRSPKVLLAMALPWLLMFALLGQMHERYLLWGAVMTAAAAVLRPSLFLLYVTLSAGTFFMILTVMLKQAFDETLPPAMAFLDGLGIVGNILFCIVLAIPALYVLWQPVASHVPAQLRFWTRRVG